MIFKKLKIVNSKHLKIIIIIVVDHFNTYCICYNIVSVLWGLFWPRGMWDVISLTRDQTRIPCVGRWSPSHFTTRGVSGERFS